MSAHFKISKTIAVGAILAAGVGCSTTPAGPSAGLSIEQSAPTAVKSAFSKWVGGGSLAKADREKCYGVSLKGENDCGAASGTSCKGAKSDCKAGAGSSCKGDKMAKADCKAGAGTSCKGDKMAKHDCKAGAGTSCKGDKMAKHDCKAGAGTSCKGDKMAKSDCKAGAGTSCKGDKMAKSDCKSGAGITCRGNATVDWQGDAWVYVPKGSCSSIVTPAGNGSTTPK
ncbi:MAG: DUF2282 domain-containing protein [Robiginitomaculum sp.]|nr:DUF2282 domain-containing protein [Robiginitomaculum sp.]